MKQLPLDFSKSSSQRHRRANKIEEKAKIHKPSLFDAPPNIDIHLHNSEEAIATFSTSTPEVMIKWFSQLVGSYEIVKPKVISFSVKHLASLLYPLPPANITLDATTQAIGRAIIADKLGLKPLYVTRNGTRLLAHSQGWPRGFSVKDVPWGAVLSLLSLEIKVEVAENAQNLFVKKIAKTDKHLAKARLSGSAVAISTNNPQLFESLNLKGLSYNGRRNLGEYKLPLLKSAPLLEMENVLLSQELIEAIKHANRKISPLRTGPNFPWSLFPFQAKDAATGIRILETTGGVLLAGDMGSGKTMVSLAIIEELQAWPILIVAPLSAFSTWKENLEKFGKNIYLVTESPKVSWSKISENEYDAIVITYDRVAAFTELLQLKNYKLILADEIQRIRTPSSKRSRALRQLASMVPLRVGLSGTPLTNTVRDLLPIGSFLSPGEWRPRASESDLADLYPNDPIDGVSEHLGSMMVRRRIEDVGTKLPKKNTHRVYVDLTVDQNRAIEDLEKEVREAKLSGEFDDSSKRMHAFAKLQKLRQITNSPNSASVVGINPKIKATLDLAQDFLDLDRKGVIFCADRATFRDLGKALDLAGIGWVGIWGATPAKDRILNEKKFHSDPMVKVVLCTIQAGSESWSASPTATWLISTAYMYAPATLDQMEARVYRMSSVATGPTIEISYIHATSPKGTLDDRMVEILAIKKELFTRVVDRREHIDQTKVHYSLSDLLFLLTGEKDQNYVNFEKDSKKAIASVEKKKTNAKKGLYKNQKTSANRDAIDSPLDKVDLLLYDEE
jgi:SNF2 family DNA or RNA helicase